MIFKNRHDYMQQKCLNYLSFLMNYDVFDTFVTFFWENLPSKRLIVPVCSCFINHILTL